MNPCEALLVDRLVALRGHRLELLLLLRGHPIVLAPTGLIGIPHPTSWLYETGPTGSQLTVYTMHGGYPLADEVRGGL